MSKLLKVPMAFFDGNPVGKILNRFSADTGVIDKVNIPEKIGVPTPALI